MLQRAREPLHALVLSAALILLWEQLRRGTLLFNSPLSRGFYLFGQWTTLAWKTLTVPYTVGENASGPTFS